MTKLVSRICGKIVHPALIRVNLLLMLFAVMGLGVQSTALHAEEHVLSDTTVRVTGYNAAALTDMIAKHQLAPDDVRVFAYDEEGDVTTDFILLIGWDSLDEVPNARGACGDVCADLTEEIHLVSKTLIEGDSTQKWVFLDLSQLANAGDIRGSIGMSACVVEQIINEVRLIEAETAPCLVRMALGSFTDRRNIGRRK